MPKPILQVVDDDGSTRLPRSQSDDAVTVSESQETPSTTRLRAEDLYPDPVARPPAFEAALGSLHEADQLVGEAITALRRSDPVLADDYATRCLQLMPRLFGFRDIGDGYALIVSSIFHGLSN